MDSHFDQYLNCIICLDYCKSAVNCQSCNNLMCEECVLNLQTNCCPSCRKEKFSIASNTLARRMIESIPKQCPYNCGTQLTLGNLDNHMINCPQRVFKCSECQVEGKREEFL